jgi:DNA-binding XRE family transcriptional regulator
MPVNTEVEQEREARAREWRWLREELLLTQTELGRLIGCSKRTVIKVEGSASTPHPPLLRRFRTLQRTHEAEWKREQEQERVISGISSK